MQRIFLMEKARLSAAILVLICLFVVVAAACACQARAAESAPPDEGAAAPDFTLTSHEGKQVSLRDFRGQWVVLYFYPKDFTSGCTIEAHNFQQDMDKFRARNAAVLG